MDEQQRNAHSLEMNALLTNVSIRVNPSSGDVKYRLTFSYPPGYDEYLKELVTGAADMYWNDVLVGQSTKITGLSVKPQKDSDPLYVAHFKLMAEMPCERTWEPQHITRLDFSGWCLRKCRYSANRNRVRNMNRFEVVSVMEPGCRPPPTLRFRHAAEATSAHP